MISKSNPIFYPWTDVFSLNQYFWNLLEWLEKDIFLSIFSIQGESVLSDHRGQVWNRLPDEQQVSPAGEMPCSDSTNGEETH